MKNEKLKVKNIVLIVMIFAFAFNNFAQGKKPNGAAQNMDKNSNTIFQMSQSPIVSFRIQFLTGAVDDPAGKEGVASLTAAMIANAVRRSFRIGSNGTPRTKDVRRLDWLGSGQTSGSLVALRRRLSPVLPLSHSASNEVGDAGGSLVVSKRSTSQNGGSSRRSNRLARSILEATFTSGMAASP